MMLRHADARGSGRERAGAGARALVSRHETTRGALACLLALLAAAPLACDDTAVAVAVGDPVPPGTPPAGGAIVVVRSGALDRDAPAARAPTGAADSAGPGRRERAASVHADRLYLPSPAGPARITADDHAVAADPGRDGKNFDADTNVDFGHDSAPRHAFLRIGLHDMPRRARILDARLEILARHADSEPGLDIYVGLVPRDGIWDDLSRRLHWGRAPSFDGIVVARAADGALLASTELPAVGAANFGIGDTGDPHVSSSQVGQTLTIARAGTLTRVEVQLRRTGPLDGSTRIRVERCRADDGGDDRPDGIPLALSEPVAAAAIGDGLRGSAVIYDFLAGPHLESGARYAFVLESDVPGTAKAHLQWKIHHGDAYPSGGLVNFGHRIAWNVVAYPEVSQLPFFFHEDRVTPRVPPFGTLVRVDDVPPFPAPDEWVDVADVTALLQEWVDAPGYRPHGVVAIELFTAPSTRAGAVRRGKDFRLRVTWRDTGRPSGRR